MLVRRSQSRDAMTAMPMTETHRPLSGRRKPTSSPLRRHRPGCSALLLSNRCIILIAAFGFIFLVLRLLLLHSRLTSLLDSAPPPILLAADVSLRVTGSDHAHAADVAAPAANAATAAASGGADFIFLVGVEGTGHHFYRKLFEASPASERLLRWGIPESAFGLRGALYNNGDMNKALLSAPCSDANDPNATSLAETVSSILRKIDAKVREGMEKDDVTAATAGGGGDEARRGRRRAASVPLNAVSGGLDQAGFLSYPNYMGECRYLQYPDLHALYYACDMAQVTCRHVVLTRDAVAVVRSTTDKHHYYKRKSTAMELHATMLDVIYAQMMDYPDRLAACWEFGDDPPDLGLRAVLGWDDDWVGREEESFRSTYTSLWKTSANISEEERRRIVTPDLEIFMATLERSNTRVKNTCRDLFLDARAKGKNNKDKSGWSTK